MRGVPVPAVEDADQVIVVGRERAEETDETDFVVDLESVLEDKTQIDMRDRTLRSGREDILTISEVKRDKDRVTQVELVKDGERAGRGHVQTRLNCFSTNHI